MRKFSTHILAAASMLAVSCLCASCTQDLEGTLYVPNSDDGKEIHFSVSAMTKTFAQEEKSGIVELSIVRPGTKGEHTVGLAQMGTDESIFSFPATAVIEDGAYGTTVPVLVDLSKCMKGSSYSTSIYIVERDQATGNYGAKNAAYSDMVDLSVSIELEWEPYMVPDPSTGEMVQQTARYTYDAFWHGHSTGLPVEKADCDDTFYRVLNWGTKDVAFMWKVQEDGSCIVPKQNTGYFNESYSQYIFVSDFPSDVYSTAGYTYKSKPCTWDFDRTFTFNLIYYREGSSGNFGTGVETLEFESIVPEKPEVEIEYMGIDSTLTGFVGARIAFTPSETAKSYSVAFFEDALTESAVEAAGDSLRKGAQPVGAVRTETLYAFDEQSWNLKEGPNTIVAVAFDADGAGGGTSWRTFSFDPEGKYAVKVNEFRFYSDPENEDYDPSRSLFGILRTSNLDKGWFVVISLSGWKSQMTKYSPEEYVKSKTEFKASEISAANGSRGRRWTYASLDPSTDYILAAVLVNKYGEEIFISDTCRTGSGSKASDIDAFRPDVTLDDFTGSYLMTVGVGASRTSTTDKTVRVDISRMDENRVVISGLAPGIDGFNPMVVAYMDLQRHCLVLDAQNAGPAPGGYARFMFSTATGSFPYNASMMLGWIEDELRWVSSPDLTYDFTGYAFRLFSSATVQNNTTSLAATVGSKVFVNPRMKKLGTSTQE